MAKKKQPKINNSELITRIDELWTRFDRARRNSNYINEIVKEHLVWTGAIENTTYNNAAPTIPSFSGKLPHLYECKCAKLANYKNSIFKSAEGMFNVEADIESEGQEQNFPTLQKANLIQKIKKGRIIESYIDALVKQIWRGETILFHEWGILKGKRQVVNQETDDDGNPVLDDDGKQKYSVEFEEYDQYEGVFVKPVEPTDFVFDVTKLNAFSSSSYDVTKFNSSECIKIRRVWMSLDEIKDNPLFDELSKEDEAKLKKMCSDTPKTEQNFDDWSNRFGYRYTNGDMIEVLEFWGNIQTNQQEKLTDYRIYTAASEVVLKCEQNPYSRCPFVWMPDLVDLTTRRGISSLVVGVEFNEAATQIFNAQKEALKFALNPAFLAGKGMHLVDGNKKVEPGSWIPYDDGLGNGDTPIELKSYQNIPLTYETQNMLATFIQDAVGTSKNNLGQAEAVSMTAQQSRDIVAGSSGRASSDIMDYTNIVIIPSLEIIATMTAENTHIDKEEKVKVSGKNGENEIAIVNDAIRKGQYNYSIGSAQAILERKSQIEQFNPLLDSLSNPLIQQTFDIKELLTWYSEPFGIQHSDRFLNKQDPQVMQLQQQIQMLQQQAQQALQQKEVEKQQLLQHPDILQNKIKNDIAALTLSKASALPQDLKDYIMQSLGIQPTSEMLEDQQKEFEQNQTKQQNQQKNAMRMQQVGGQQAQQSVKGIQ